MITGTDSAPLRCNRCHRVGFDAKEEGYRCVMTQPDGKICGGTFKRGLERAGEPYPADEHPALICTCGMKFHFTFKNQFFDKSFRCPECNTAYTVRGSNRYVE